MKNKKLSNFELASTIKNIEKTVISKFELAEEKNYMDVTYILASSVPNANGALFTKEELTQAKDSIINQPLIILPSWEDGTPTGHSVIFPKLDFDAKVVGTHIESSIIEEDGITHLKTKSRIWSIRYPEIASMIRSLHDVGNLQFSMESSYQSQTIEGSVRTLHGVDFVGSAIVDNGANPFSYSLEVANKNKQKEEYGMTLEEALKKIGVLEGEVETANKAKDTAETAANELKSSLETANKSIDTLKGEVAEFQTKEKTAKEDEIASSRLTEMAKYVTYTDEEKTAKKATFASMDQSIFDLILETAKRNKPEPTNEIAGLSSDTSLKTDKGFFDGIENLD